MNSLKGRISNGCADFMNEVHIAMANGQAPAPRPRQTPTPSPAPAAHVPAPAQGGQPPHQPPVQGGGGGGSGGGSAWFSKDSPLVWLVILLLLVFAYMAVTYVTTNWISDANNRAQLQAQPAPSPIQSSAPPVPFVQNQIRTIDNITDGMEVALPENARVILRGPMTVTFIDSTATRIKGFTGDFKLHIEGSQNFAWTPGFSSEAAPMSPSDFLGHLRRILAKKPNQVKVKMFINNGVVELNT